MEQVPNLRLHRTDRRNDLSFQWIPAGLAYLGSHKIINDLFKIRIPFTISPKRPQARLHLVLYFAAFLLHVDMNRFIDQFILRATKRLA